MARPKHRSESGEAGKRNAGVAGMVATALAVLLAIALTAGCSPTSVTGAASPSLSASPALTAATADATPPRGRVTVYHQPN